ncbi:hypothetical protein EVAR_47180_1 [Eumeta japonica]|uniref:Uncharacterized protein n=1 Tax=Eumeta variegata TaxID=151549 RepID=A0A4C1WTG8_EUMVA|nr:hypothetical protein EVAR_47180_1 [Eumeta japonica]
MGVPRGSGKGSCPLNPPKVVCSTIYYAPFARFDLKKSDLPSPRPEAGLTWRYIWQICRYVITEKQSHQCNAYEIIFSKFEEWTRESGQYSGELHAEVSFTPRGLATELQLTMCL